jgi:hypothetical protein
MYRYEKVNIDNIKDINDLGVNGWRVISSTDNYVLMEQEYDPALQQIALMPVRRTIGDPYALYNCKSRIKRYTWDDHMEPTEFITIDEFKHRDFYTDDGEYEAYLSDGFYFLGTDVSAFTDDELNIFIKEQKNKFREPDDLKIYFIDYPEDK